MKIDYFNMDMQELSATANHVKDRVIDELVGQKFVTEEQATLLKNEYAVVLIRKGWFSTFIEKTFGLDGDDKGSAVICYKLVKLTSPKNVAP